MPNAQRAAIITGIELSIYDSAKQFLLSQVGLSNSIPTHFIASGMAGFCAAVAATPLDVIKARIMTQSQPKSDPSSVVYKGSIDCLVKVKEFKIFKKIFVNSFLFLF